MLVGLTVRNLLTDRFEVGNATLNYYTESAIGIAYNGVMLQTGFSFWRAPKGTLVMASDPRQPILDLTNISIF